MSTPASDIGCGQSGYRSCSLASWEGALAAALAGPGLLNFLAAGARKPVFPGLRRACAVYPGAVRLPPGLLVGAELKQPMAIKAGA